MAFSLANVVVLDRYLGGIGLLVLKPIVILLGRIMRRDHSLAPKGDILIIKLLGAGSLFIALPNLLGLRRTYSDRKIHLLTTPAVAKFARSLRIFDDIHLIDHGSGIRLAGSVLRVVYRLRSIDTVIDLEAHSRAATLLALFLCARNRLAFFVDEIFWKRRIATHLVFLSRSAAIYEFYDQIFALLGSEPGFDDRRSLSSPCGLRSNHADAAATPAHLHRPRIQQSGEGARTDADRLGPRPLGGILAAR